MTEALTSADMKEKNNQPFNRKLRKVEDGVKNLAMRSPERTAKAFVKITIDVNWSVHGRNLQDEK